VLKQGDKVILSADGVMLQKDMIGTVVKVGRTKVHVFFDDWPLETVFDPKDNALRKCEETHGLSTSVDST
jgi:hypothetical protein